MKRTDLKVGETYLSSRYNDWEKYANGAQKVTVLSLKPLGFRRPRLDTPNFVLTLDDGTTVELPKSVTDTPPYGERATDVAVRFEPLDPGSKPLYGTAPTRNIRGLWEECRARQEEVCKAERERADAARKASEERAKRWKSLEERLRAAGVEGFISSTVWTRGAIELSFDQLEHLLDRIADDGPSSIDDEDRGWAAFEATT